MDSLSIMGVVADGRVRPMGHAPTLDAFCRRLGDGAELTITIEPKKDKRSLAQNATLWGPVYDQCLDKIMAHFGYDADEINDTDQRTLAHYGLLAKCFGTRVDKISGIESPKRTSSQLNTADFSEYLQWIQRFCAKEIGVVVELPDEVR